MLPAMIQAEALRLFDRRVASGTGLGPDGKDHDGATPCVTPTEIARNLAPGFMRGMPGGHRAVETALQAAGWRCLQVSNKLFFRPVTFDGTALKQYAEKKLAAAKAKLEERRARWREEQARRAGFVSNFTIATSTGDKVCSRRVGDYAYELPTPSAPHGAWWKLGSLSDIGAGGEYWIPVASNSPALAAALAKGGAL